MQKLPPGRGITVSEIAPMDRPIEPYETSAVFIGRALRGPLNTPVSVKSFTDFCRRFGGRWHCSSLGPAVQRFFEHGGRLLWVVRVANGARGARLRLPAGEGVLSLRAVEPGAGEKLRASVDYDDLGPDADTPQRRFNLTVQRVSPDSGLVIEQEIYRRLSCEPDDDRHAGRALARSALVAVEGPLPAQRPLPTTDSHGGRMPGYVDMAHPGIDGDAPTDYDLIGSAVQGTGLFALEELEHFDLLYIPPPDVGRDIGPAATLAADSYCRRRGAMLVLDPPAAWDSADAAVAGLRRNGFASANALSYFPRVRVRGGGSPVEVAGAALAGLLCKLDRGHGPWQSLARPDLALRRALVPAVEVDDDAMRRLAQAGLNVILRRGNGPALVRNSVTLCRGSGADREFRQLGVRRLCLAMTAAIGRATRWAVFEADSTTVTARTEAQIAAYLAALADAGAITGVHDLRCEAQPCAGRRGVSIFLSFRPAAAKGSVALTLHQTVSGCRVAGTAFSPARCA